MFLTAYTISVNSTQDVATARTILTAAVLLTAILTNVVAPKRAERLLPGQDIQASC